MSIEDNKSKEEGRWDKTFRLLTRDLTPRQALVYKIIFETMWDLEFTFLPTLPYDEIVLRAIFETHPRERTFQEELWAKQGKEEHNTIIDYLLEKEGKEVENIIDELCAKAL
jgi:hypothetical protein